MLFRRFAPSSTLAIALAVALAAVQEPAPQQPPPQQAQEPAGAGAAGKPPEPHPFEGVYELRRRVVAGLPDRNPSTGYLAITKRHMFVCLAAPGPEADKPLLRAGIRTWIPERGGITTTGRLGWFTDAEGRVRIEKADTVESRRFEVGRGFVRLLQDQANYLEFVRVE